MRRAVLSRFALVLLLALAISGICSYYFIGKNLLHSQEESMLEIVRMIDYSLDYNGDIEKQFAQLANTILNPDSRITLVHLDGTVTADNRIAQVDRMENHLEREEIKEALQSGVGYATRYSESLGRNLLYVAAKSYQDESIIRVAVPYTNLLDYMVQIFPALLLGTVIAFFVSVVIAVRFTGTITTPLREISREMEKVRGDNPAFAFKKYRYAELNVISDTTIKMSGEIRDHMDRLEKEKKIRQEFFSNASHELKTPITSIRGYAELLEQDFVKDEAMRKDFVSRILKETDNMTNLINDILMISRLEAKEAEVTFSLVRMGPLLEEILVSLEPIAAQYQVELHQECEPVSMMASAKQIRELLMNLVGNGIKYNHPGGNVWIEIEEQGDQMVFRVRDDGCGIRIEDQERIFERFYRVDKGRSKKMGGTGLGLSIVKHIVEYYEGSVQLWSRPGEGSEFVVRLPIRV